MATNMNLQRKPNLGEYGSNMPIDYNINMAVNNMPANLSSLPMSQNAVGPASMGSPATSPFPQNHFNQGVNSFPGQSRQFQENFDGLARIKYSHNSNMAAPTYGVPFESSSNDPYQIAMTRKYRPNDVYTMNKNMDPSNFVSQQQRNVSNEASSWPLEYANRNNRMLSIQKPGMSPVGRHEPNFGQAIPPDQNFHSPGSSGSPQHSYQMQAMSLMPSEAFKLAQERPFPTRGISPANYNPQELYQQDTMRQMANYQQAQMPRVRPNYLAVNQRNSASPFGHSVIQKSSPDGMYHQQPFNSSPKSNGPHPIIPNMVDDRQIVYPNTNYPGGPTTPQITGKPGYPPSLPIRGVSPNVTIGLPKKPAFRQQEEAVTSPGATQNAAAAAAAAAVLAAVNTANPNAQPDSQSMGSRPPSVPMIPSRPPSIHSKDPRSPSTSIISDHKSESGGSGINDIRATPSPARSQNPTQQNEQISSVNLPLEFETGRVPSPSLHQLRSSDVEALIQPVSNLPVTAELSIKEPNTSHKRKLERKQEYSNNSAVLASPPLSISPSLNVDFDIDMISASLEDTPLNKLYRISNEPFRKDFLDTLVSLMEQDGKSLNQIPLLNGSLLDIFKLYQIVLKRGGMHEVSRRHQWTEVAVELLSSSSGVRSEHGHVLKEHYARLLLPYEEKLGGGLSLPVTINPPVPSGNHPTNPEPRSIDLSTMTYKNLFQGNPKTASYSQSPVPNAQPPALSNTTPVPSSQGYASTPPIQHPSYRNTPGFPQTPSGYPNYPQGSPRLTGYPSGHPAYPNHQYGNVQGATSQMSNYHNGVVPTTRFANFPRNTVPPETMFAQFNRASVMNKPFQHDPQSQAMFPNYQQPGQQHPPGYMYQQQQAAMAAYQMERRNTNHGGMASPRPRIQPPWSSRFPDTVGTSSNTPSSFHNAQSPGMKSSRPPPPYPHSKQEKPSPTPQSAAAALQYQAIKSGLSQVKKEDEIFPSGCVETTQVVLKKKRRLTARDLGPVEAWRIMMSLKSGLLTETAWALDTLTILLSDDATVGFFKLGHLPGFLDTVVEHFRRNLINVFGILRETEIPSGVPERFCYGNKDCGAESHLNDVFLQEIARENFSAIIVSGCLPDSEDQGFSGGRKDWIAGGGDTTVHIQTHFETDPYFYEGMNEDGQTEGVMDNPCPVLHMVESYKVEDQNVSFSPVHERSGNSDIARASTANDVESMEDKKVSCVDDETHKKCNGLPSPDEGDSVEQQRTSTDSGTVVKQDMIDSLGQEKDCCGTQNENIVDNCRCDSSIVIKKMKRQNDCDEIEEESSSNPVEKKEDPSSLLIKKLKTELDLEVEKIGQDSEDIVTSSAEKTGSEVKSVTSMESECELRQEFPLSSLTLSQDSAIKTCNCVSNIVRNLSFVPGNDVEMARNPSLLLILAKLLVLHHVKRSRCAAVASDRDYNDTDCWWQDCLETIRENTLVTVANIAGYLDFSHLATSVSRPLLDGLLHWLTCQSAVADEPLRSTSISVILTPKQLVLETLAKMSVLAGNVDYIFTFPDKARLVTAYEYLVKLFSDKTNEVTREFALVLLSSFSQTNEEICDSSSERNLVTVLVGFLEDSRDRVESMAVRGLHPGMFRDNDLRVSMGMLRRAAGLLACIVKRTKSRHLIAFQERILDLSMSRALDAEVQSHLSNVLFHLAR